MTSSRCVKYRKFCLKYVHPEVLVKCSQTAGLVLEDITASIRLFCSLSTMVLETMLCYALVSLRCDRLQILYASPTAQLSDYVRYSLFSKDIRFQISHGTQVICIYEHKNALSFKRLVLCTLDEC